MCDISVVVPVLNEVRTLKSNLAYFKRLESCCRELIFVDGGSADGSLSFLESHFSLVFSEQAGRALQMNCGARQAKGKSLLFLHVDTSLELPLPNGEIENALWGFFCIRLTGTQRIFRLIESGINFRSRMFNLGTGDQCLFFNRQHFLEQGGFPNQALMEDVEISRRHKRMHKPLIIRQTVLSSSRRWEKHGPIKTVLLMWSIQLLYKLGVSTGKLARWYGYKNVSEPARNKNASAKN